MKGLFISFEGPDGSGKTTQFQRVCNWLREQKKEIVISREPGGTKIGEKIREILLSPDNKEMHERTEALLFAAARAQNVEEVILPALSQGKIVLCDRFVHSSYVYQGIARGLGIEHVKKINEFATGGVYPDLTLYYQIPLQISLERTKKRGNRDRLEQEKENFHQEVFEGFQEIAKRFSKEIEVINGEEAEEMVFWETKRIIEERMGKMNGETLHF